MSFLKIVRNYSKHPVMGSMKWQLASNGSRMFFGLLSAILLTRYFGPENYGIYSFILAITGIFSLFNRAGSDNIALKYLTTDRAQGILILGSALLWRNLVWLLGLAVLFLLALFFDDTRYWYALLLYGFMFFTSFDVLDHVFQAEYTNKYTVLARIATESLAFAMKLYLVLGGHSLAAFIWVHALQHLVYAIAIVAFFYYRKHTLPRFGFSKEYFVRIARESLPMFFAAFLTVLYVRIDQIMISYMVGDTALGYYSASSQITIAVFGLAIVTAQPMQVKFLELGIKTERYDRWLEYYFHIITRGAYLLSFALMVAAPFMVPLLFGAAYAPTVVILMVQIWTCVFIFQGTAKQREIINRHKSAYNLYASAMGVVTNIVLNFLLIPHYQGLGAAIATIISQGVSTYVSSWLIPDLRKLAIIQTKALFLRKAPHPDN